MRIEYVVMLLFILLGVATFFVYTIVDMFQTSEVQRFIVNVGRGKIIGWRQIWYLHVPIYEYYEPTTYYGIDPFAGYYAMTCTFGVLFVGSAGIICFYLKKKETRQK